VLRDQVRDAVERIATDRTFLRADQVASLMGMSLRTLQTVFQKYVGCLAKVGHTEIPLARGCRNAREWRGNEELAFQLGYFDQAHFIRDFKSNIGKTPLNYTKS
jgi:AraC-like DNA-binding protein